MSRTIDADALINELNNSHYPGAPYIDAGISIAIGKVCDAPTIEPELPEWAQKVEKYRKSAPSHINNPLAWALYQTWKEYDKL